MQALIAKGTETAGFDPRKFSKRTIRLLFIGLPALFLLFHYKDDLVTMAWDVVQIGYAAIAALIAFAIFGVLWKQLGNFSDFMSRTCLSWWIEYNPWVLQFKEIDKAEENWDKTIAEKEKIVGEWTKLKNKVFSNQEAGKQAYEAEKLVREKLKDSSLSKEGRIQHEQELLDEQQKQADCLNYIKINGPLVKDMETIVETIKSAQIVMKHKIERMRTSLRQLQDTYESSTAGANALTAMKKCLTGDRVLNDQSEQSKLKVYQDIAMNIGSMRTSMEIINDITSNNNLQDAAKMAVARQQLSELGITDGVIPIDNFQTTNFTGMVPVSDMRFTLPD